MGIVVYNPQALKSHFLPFIGQLRRIQIRNVFFYIYDPLSIYIHVSTGGITLFILSDQ